MNIVWTLGMAMAGASLAGCAGAPAASQQDIEFVRGCWVDKNAQDHRIDAFLRLLPDGSDYAGHLQFVRGVRPGPEISVSIAQDGSRASVTQNGERIDLPAQATTSSLMGDGSRRIIFSGTANGRHARIEVAGKADRLALTVLNGVSTLGFDGERDNCG